MEAKEVIQILNAKLEKVPKAEVRSLGLEVLPRLIGVLHRQAGSCPDCRNFHDHGVMHVEEIVSLFGPEVSDRKKFEVWVEGAQQHLKHHHGMVAKGRTGAVYILAGIGFGLVTGSLVTYLTGGTNILSGAILGWVCGMLIGWIVGKIKENKLRQEDLLY